MCEQKIPSIGSTDQTSHVMIFSDFCVWWRTKLMLLPWSSLITDTANKPPPADGGEEGGGVGAAFSCFGCEVKTYFGNLQQNDFLPTVHLSSYHFPWVWYLLGANFQIVNHDLWHINSQSPKWDRIPSPSRDTHHHQPRYTAQRNHHPQAQSTCGEFPVHQCQEGNLLGNPRSSICPSYRSTSCTLEWWPYQMRDSIYWGAG